MRDTCPRCWPSASPKRFGISFARPIPPFAKFLSSPKVSSSTSTRLKTTGSRSGPGDSPTTEPIMEMRRLRSEMKSVGPIRSVYSYYYPEVREIIDRVTHVYPHHVYLRSIDPGLDEF